MSVPKNHLSVPTGQLKVCKKLGAYDLADVIGKGTYGEVRHGVKRATGERFAIKCISQERCSVVDREIAIMKRLHHPNVVDLVEILRTKSMVYLVLELVEGGDLSSFLSSREGKLDEREARWYFHQLMQGVQYCHSKEIAHRDLKPENLLLNPPVLKVSDFGLSNLQRTNVEGTVTESLKLQTVCGTPQYLAPEVILKGYQPEGQGYSGFRADMWSCGVILYLMLTAHRPFEHETTAGLCAKILRGVYSDDPLPPDARTLVAAMLSKDPTQRPGATAALSHPWVLDGLDELKQLSRTYGGGAPGSPTSPRSHSKRDCVVQ